MVEIDPLGALPFSIELEMVRKDRDDFGLDEMVQIWVEDIGLPECMRVGNESLVLMVWDYCKSGLEGDYLMSTV